MAMNIEADRVEASATQRVMNSCHGVWSVGYLLATLLGTLAEGAPSDRRSLHLGLLAIPLVPAALFITLGIEPAPPRPHTAQVVRRLSLPTLPILLLVAFTIGPNLLEGALRNWSVIYMRDSFAAPSWVDTLTLPVFLVAQSDRPAQRRPAGDALRRRCGWRAGSTSRRSSAALLVVLAPNLYVALAGFLCVGVGVCISYPLTTSAAARLGDRPSSQNVASLTFASAADPARLAARRSAGSPTNLGIRPPSR